MSYASKKAGARDIATLLQGLVVLMVAIITAGIVIVVMAGWGLLRLLRGQLDPKARQLYLGGLLAIGASLTMVGLHPRSTGAGVLAVLGLVLAGVLMYHALRRPIRVQAKQPPPQPVKRRGSPKLGLEHAADRHAAHPPPNFKGRRAESLAQLNKLIDLHSAGVLTTEEYANLKARLLDAI